jgi:Cu(I)/Ag(I) efflux system membrane protein CusA/SilA
MIEKIIEYSIRNRFLVIICTFALVAWGVYAVINTPVDAIPDLSENQVIVFTDWMGRSPQEIEDQITYPLSVNLQGLAGVKAVRSSSEFNFSMINIIFEDKIDFYFARQRVLERLTLASTFLPPGVTPYLAPDATALGQIFWYTVEGEGTDLGRLRAIQDWYVRYQLNSVPGVAQVASVGGYPIEYQIDVDPNKLRAYGVTLGDLFAAVSRSNSAVGGRVIHKGNAEYLIRGVGWIGTDKDPIADIKNIVVKTTERTGTPIYISNLATVSLGTQFRRSVLEKDGNEVVGGVCMMRYGENPLAVTKAIKQKIEQLQAGLPEGVRIVPFYDRTRLIHGAIHTLTEILTHETIIASLAVLLILMHVGSAFVICVTLPLAVLVSFILMRLFNIPSNIMSLAGIAISIGILVDQAIVMFENATHHLTLHFGKGKVHGDTRELVIPACRTVGRPIFFSVMIILISFLPVFSLHGMEGKTFHPLAFTKSFAMIGVAVLSITLVPALIPTFIRGRIRSEQESWLVRTMIDIYKPVLTWALPRWNLVLWLFAVLLILGAGLFPLQAVFGIEWKTGFLATWAIVTTLTVVFMQGRLPQIVGLLSLAILGVWAYGFTKIGVEYMPPLDEGSIMDMPITVPRASVVEGADDIKVRDAILRSFPEVELVVGKDGRAETPTDPAPLDMIETVVNLYPKEFWSKRHMRYEDAEVQTKVALQSLVDKGLVTLPALPDDKAVDERANLDASRRKAIVDPAAMSALTRLDKTLREFVLTRDREFRAKLAHDLTRAFVGELVARWQKDRRLLKPVASPEVDSLAAELSRTFGNRLAVGAAQEDVNRLVQKIAERLDHEAIVRLTPELFRRRRNDFQRVWEDVGELLGAEKPTFFSSLFDFVQQEHDRRWVGRLSELNREIFDQAVGAFDWYCLEELQKSAKDNGNWTGPPATQGDTVSKPAIATDEAIRQLHDLRAELDGPFARRLLMWTKAKADIVKEMDSALQIPGWGNIWTQPIINRIDMLATGVRTMIGVKVFGKDLQEIQMVSEQIAAALRTVRGAVDVLPDQNVGKGYIEIKIDRQKAARYGVSVGDVQDVIEVALGGKPITMTVEGRERHPVRIRYARAFRDDEEKIKDLLVSAGNASGGGMPATGETAESGGMTPHGTGVVNAAAASRPLQVPLKMVADVKIVEGPAMIKSENGLLRSYVQLNVRDRDIVGFVDEAQRVVAQEVVMPPGMYIEWSGQFEHQIRARNTLKIVFPAVLALIFIILYLTYNDLADAVLMMMAVPEALVGGVFFLWLRHTNFSVAVWVGFIACFGMATETGIIMLVYLREAIEKRGGLANIKSLEELREAIIEGAVHRLRPKLLTEGVAILALAPMLWHTGVGHEVISAMAAPVLGGLLIADEVVDVFIPVRFYWIRRNRWLKLRPRESTTENAYASE